MSDFHIYREEAEFLFQPSIQYWSCGWPMCFCKKYIYIYIADSELACYSLNYTCYWVYALLHIYWVPESGFLTMESHFFAKKMRRASAPEHKYLDIWNQSMCSPFCIYLSQLYRADDAGQWFKNSKECILPHIEESFQALDDDWTNIKHILENCLWGLVRLLDISNLSRKYSVFTPETLVCWVRKLVKSAGAL